MRSQTISAVHEASGTTRLTVPNRVLSWWWSMFRMCIGCLPAPWNASAGLRSRFPQSRNTIVRSSRSSGGAVTRPSSGRKSYSCGSGNSDSAMNISESLPRELSTLCIATSEPSASPSGCSWVIAISLAAERSSSRTRARSGPDPLSPIVRMLLVEQLGDAHPSLHGFVEAEGQQRRVLERQLRGEPALEEPVRSLQRLQRLLALGLVAEDAHIYARVAQVGAGFDCRHGYEADSWVGEIFGDRIAEDRPHRLVDASHAAVAHPIPPFLMGT